jgi:UDP-N-acetylglucosamine--N-acetylmuramyl-(pentapeptide) pyrophosphoryl-undecaprenol N-acetylglucosamine transferase
LGYNEAAKFFNGKAEKVFTGNPIREDILKTTREEAVKTFKLDPRKQTILVAGGSLGRLP